MNGLILLVFGIVTCFNSCFSQISTDRYAQPIIPPTHIERYNIDYKLVDESIISSDSTILNQIDLEGLESQRATNHDVTVHDNETNLDVILFYKKRSNQPNSLNNSIGL